MRRRGAPFRLIAHFAAATFLAQILPLTAFADLSVPFRIPIAEWRKAMRAEMAVEFLCVMLPKPGEEKGRGPSEEEKNRGERQRQERSAAAHLMRVSMAPSRMAAPRTVEEAIDQGYTCREVRRGRNLRVSETPEAVTRPSLADGQKASGIPSGLDADGKARIPIEEWRAALGQSGPSPAPWSRHQRSIAV